MVGNEVGEVRSTVPHRPGAEMLKVDDLSLAAGSLHGMSLSRINLVAHAGEVVGNCRRRRERPERIVRRAVGRTRWRIGQRDRDGGSALRQHPASTRDVGSARLLCRRNGSATPPRRRIV